MTPIDHTFLWLLTQSSNRGYDTYDSCIVAADTAEDAVLIHPSEYVRESNKPWGRHSGWATTPSDVHAEKIGVTKAERRGTMILSSFNAG